MPGYFLSAKFKFQNPSTTKTNVLNSVLSDYTSGFRALLDYSRESLDDITKNGKYRLLNKETGEVVSEKYSAMSIGSLLPSPKYTDGDFASCLKEALTANIAAALASFLALSESDKQEAGFPVSRNESPTAWEDTLALLCEGGTDIEREKLLAGDLQRVSRGRFMPVHFSRSRDFALVANKEMTKFFVFLKMLPPKSPLAKKVDITPDAGLIVLSKYGKFKAGEPFKYRGSSGVLFPVQIGKNGWQLEKFLRPCLEGGVVAKAAKLAKEGDDFYLHVSFQFDKPKEYKPETYMGIDRGMIYSLAYGIVDKKGAIIETGYGADPFQKIKERAARRVAEQQKKSRRITKKDYKQQEQDAVLHSVINSFLDIAEAHKSKIVFEDIEGLKNVGKFRKSAYQKILDITVDKAARRGIPLFTRRVNGKKKPGIWAAYTSQLCIHCGCKDFTDRGKGENRAVIHCSACDITEMADPAAGVNIARRAMYQKRKWGGDKDKKGDYFMFHKSMAQGGDFRAKDDLQNNRIEIQCY